MVSKGVDGDNEVFPMRVNDLGHQYHLITDGTHNLSINSMENIKAAYATPGEAMCYHVNLCKRGIGADTVLMMIDLSDIIKWPHTATDRITLYNIQISIAASKLAEGCVSLGYLDNVDSTNGDFFAIHNWEAGLPGTNEATHVNQVIDYTWRGYNFNQGYWFGPSKTNDILIQDDVNLYGPDGNTAYPSGNGDCAIYVDWTAGSIDVACALSYTTFET